jgi:hypothetical protein
MANQNGRSPERESRPANAGRLPKCQLAGDSSEYTEKLTTEQRTIVLRPVLDRVLAAVRPPILGNSLDLDFADRGQALAYANALRKAHGWAIVERIGGAA